MKQDVISEMFRAELDKLNSQNRISLAQSALNFFSRGKSSTTSKSVEFLKNLQHDLNFYPFMSPSDLFQALVHLENLRFVSVQENSGVKNLPVSRTLEQALVDNSYRTLADFNSPIEIPRSPEILNRLIPNPELFEFLEKIYLKLYNRFEIAYAHAQKKTPFSSLSYDEKLLKESQALTEELETTTKQNTSKSNIVSDVLRHGVTINGEVLSDKEQVFRAIEQFAGGSIQEEGSKAQKIFYHGGQYLQTIFLDEFKNSSVLTRDSGASLEPGKTKGHIDWFKDEQNGNIQAKISLEIYYLSSFSPDSPQKFLALGSDGSTLEEVEDLEFLHQFKDEFLAKNQRVPVCTISAELKFTREVIRGPIEDIRYNYYLEPSRFTINSNTPDLISTKGPEFSPTINFRP